MFFRAIIPLVLLSLAACKMDNAPSTIPFRLDARHGAILDSYVVLKVQNDGDVHLCVPLIETRLGNGNMTVVPISGNDPMENRPPARLVGGLDVLEGLAVLPPRKSQTFLVSLERLKDRDPQATELRGTISGAPCQALFSASPPDPTERTFSVRLLPFPETR